MNLEEILQSLQEAKKYYLTNLWKEIEDPNDVSDLRIRLAALYNALGAFVAPANQNVSEAKGLKAKRELELRKTAEKGAKRDAELQAEVDTMENLWRAEHERDLIKYALKGTEEILNALASKYKALENNAKNLL